MDNIGRYLTKKISISQSTNITLVNKNFLCSSASIVFTHGLILGFFAPQGRHIAPIKVEFGMEERTVGADRTSMPNSTLIGSGVGVYGPKTEKIAILPI